MNRHQKRQRRIRCRVGVLAIRLKGRGCAGRNGQHCPGYGELEGSCQHRHGLHYSSRMGMTFVALTRRERPFPKLDWRHARDGHDKHCLATMRSLPETGKIGMGQELNARIGASPQQVGYSDAKRISQPDQGGKARIGRTALDGYNGPLAHPGSRNELIDGPVSGMSTFADRLCQNQSRLALRPHAGPPASFSGTM